MSKMPNEFFFYSISISIWNYYRNFVVAFSIGKPWYNILINVFISFFQFFGSESTPLQTLSQVFWHVIWCYMGSMGIMSMSVISW